MRFYFVVATLCVIMAHTNPQVEPTFKNTGDTHTKYYSFCSIWPNKNCYLLNIPFNSVKSKKQAPEIRFHSHFLLPKHIHIHNHITTQKMCSLAVLSNMYATST